jgi:hypothetical protein
MTTNNDVKTEYQPLLSTKTGSYYTYPNKEFKEMIDMKYPIGPPQNNSIRLIATQNHMELNYFIARFDSLESEMASMRFKGIGFIISALTAGGGLGCAIYSLNENPHIGELWGTTITAFVPFLILLFIIIFQYHELKKHMNSSRDYKNKIKEKQKTIDTYLSGNLSSKERAVQLLFPLKLNRSNGKIIYYKFEGGQLDYHQGDDSILLQEKESGFEFIMWVEIYSTPSELFESDISNDDKLTVLVDLQTEEKISLITYVDTGATLSSFSHPNLDHPVVGEINVASHGRLERRIMRYGSILIADLKPISCLYTVGSINILGLDIIKKTKMIVDGSKFVMEDLI